MIQLFHLLFLWVLQPQYGMNLYFPKLHFVACLYRRIRYHLRRLSKTVVRYVQGCLPMVGIWRLLWRFISWISFGSLVWECKCCTYRYPKWGKWCLIFLLSSLWILKKVIKYMEEKSGHLVPCCPFYLFKKYFYKSKPLSFL